MGQGTQQITTFFSTPPEGKLPAIQKKGNTFNQAGTTIAEVISAAANFLERSGKAVTIPSLMALLVTPAAANQPDFYHTPDFVAVLVFGGVLVFGIANYCMKKINCSCHRESERIPDEAVDELSDMVDTTKPPPKNDLENQIQTNPDSKLPTP